MADDRPVLHPLGPGHVVACLHPDVELQADGRLPCRDEEAPGVSLVPLFGEAQVRLRDVATALRAAVGPSVPDLSRFFRARLDRDVPESEHQELVDALNGARSVETAFFKRAADRASGPHDTPAPGAAEGDPLMPTPDFTARQGYLGPAPSGVDAFSAWSLPGGFGEDVRIVDIEDAWRFSHEDLILNQGGVLNQQPDNLEWRNHGTAVAGIISGDLNAFGVTGICPGAMISGISADGEDGGTAAAIRRAADRLRPGDIILIELQTPGPVAIANGIDRNTQVGFIPLEFWPDDFAAIRYATARGVIVVSAAGNGAEDLDAAGKQGALAAATAWANPFDRDQADSGAIFVGAGAPPGFDEIDRSRLPFSNYGRCVDTQGWGKHVVTTGGVLGQPGDLQGGEEEDRWYTQSFSGTSSAAPMIAGALACVQGILRAAGQSPLTPDQARTLLRQTGSPQQSSSDSDADTERIGSRPNLRELIPRALAFSGIPDGLASALSGPATFMTATGTRITITIDDARDVSSAYASGPAHWGGPHWGGPHWGGPTWPGNSGFPFQPAPFVSGPRAISPTVPQRRIVRRPGFPS